MRQSWRSWRLLKSNNTRELSCAVVWLRHMRLNEIQSMFLPLLAIFRILHINSEQVQPASLSALGNSHATSRCQRSPCRFDPLAKPMKGGSSGYSFGNSPDGNGGNSYEISLPTGAHVIKSNGHEVRPYCIVLQEWIRIGLRRPARCTSSCFHQSAYSVFGVANFLERGYRRHARARIYPFKQGGLSSSRSLVWESYSNSSLGRIVLHSS